MQTNLLVSDVYHQALRSSLKKLVNRRVLAIDLDVNV